MKDKEAKFAKLKKLKERGVIPYSVWVFERKLCEGCRKLRSVLYRHSCGWNICCDCWRLGKKHPNHFQTRLAINRS